MTSPSTHAHPLLSSVDWPRISRTTERELHNREQYAPGVSAFRWWARRPHTVMGALLDAAMERYGPELTVADPFSGGGTVAFEAVRRRLKTYAQDLYPWPTYGLSTTIRPVQARALERAAADLLVRLDHLRTLYRRPDGRELSHIIRVRSVECHSCSRAHFLYPYSLISLLSRSSTSTRAYFGCAVCGAVSVRGAHVRCFRCSECGWKHSAQDPLNGCPHCAEPSPPIGDASRAMWHPILVQEVIERERRTVLRPLERGDPVADLASCQMPASLRIKIPDGVETRRLTAGGFKKWEDLYARRQVFILIGALQEIRRLSVDAAIQDRLALAVLGAAEMPAYLSRWDRFHLKQFEALANHRYSPCGIAVESNVLAPVGRGTLRLRVNAACKCARWLRASAGSTRRVATAHSNSPGRRPKRWDVLVATGSSHRQALTDRSVHVVLTDPPYHDDVQYGELARLFHQWLSFYRPLRPIDEHQEAVSNPRRRGGKWTFQKMIGACLAESCRTLRKDGVLILTFHNRRLIAWRALASALVEAGFEVRAIAAVHAENADDHCKRNVATMLNDLVLECTRRTAVLTRTRLAFAPKSATEKNLTAIGLALATAVRARDTRLLASEYISQLAKLRGRKRLIN
jgi:putative DNA methylase